MWLYLDTKTRLFLPTSYSRTLVSINGEYILDVLLKQAMLPDIVQFLAISFFSWTVHPPVDRARETGSFFHCCQSATSQSQQPDLNPVDYKVWGTMQDLSLIHI